MDQAKTNILTYGKEEDLPQGIPLQAGEINLLYEQGFIRYINWGEYEILRMINHAVRDHNWGTIPLTILEQNIHSTTDSFTITYIAEAKQGGIHVIWNCKIEGTQHSQVVFTIEGEAQSTFRRNRMGFTVLHPVTECAGTKVTITHSGETQSNHQFPRLISPHQPFLDIQAMDWTLSNGIHSKLEFSGDVFETEDQRNWIDDSYKTYCTPLALPFPVLVEKGDRVVQQIILSVSGPHEERAHSNASNTYTFKIGDHPSTLPSWGIGQSTETEKLSHRECSLIKALSFNHYQIDLKLSTPDWTSHWQRTLREVDQLEIPLELNLFFDHPSSELSHFIHVYEEAPIPLRMINVFHQQFHVTPNDILDNVIPVLRSTFPGIHIGAGTNAFFTELNRERIDPNPVDYLVYSINPQVHAFDNLSLVETLNAIPYTVRTTKEFSQGKSVHISPITFKMRWNPNATGEATTLPDQLPDDVDVRQMSLFGASWLLGCLNSLIKSPVESITFFETIGMKGIMQSGNPLYPDIFKAPINTVYPLYFIFYLLKTYKAYHCFPIIPSDKLVLTGFVFEEPAGDRSHLLLGNLTNEQITVEIPPTFHGQSGRLIDAENIESLVKAPESLTDIAPLKLQRVVSLSPYAILWTE